MLAAIVVPVQTALSLLMATMVSKMENGRDFVLYSRTIPLGISDLAAGLIWCAIFEQLGFLNSMMRGRVVHSMIADGLRQADDVTMANRIVAASMDLIEKSGSAEYYDPIDAPPCGGGRFT